MQGLFFSDNQDFVTRFAPLLTKFEPLWWFADFQSGPFSSIYIYENEETERRFEQIHFQVPICKHTSSQVWRPGTLPELAPHIVFDEWSYLVGFEANEMQVESIVNQFAGARGFTSPDFFLAVQQNAHIYIR